MRTCVKMVEQGGLTSFPCTVEIPDDRSVHEGPCACPDKPASMRARERWRWEQVKPPEEPGDPVPHSEMGMTGWMLEDAPSTPTKQRVGDQPLPTRSDRPLSHEQMIEDVRSRLAVGITRYGTGLQAMNGRNTLLDAYEESLDMGVYLRTALEERKEMLARIEEVLSSSTLKASPDIIALLHDLKKWLEA